MTHEEKTRIIAEFDGWEFVNDDEDYPEGCFINADRGVFSPYQIMELPYDDYNGLMPVWHKLRKEEISFPNDQTTAYVEMMGAYYRLSEKIKHAILFKEIEDVFNAISEAIEWYNTTKK